MEEEQSAMIETFPSVQQGHVQKFLQGFTVGPNAIHQQEDETSDLDAETLQSFKKFLKATRNACFIEKLSFETLHSRVLFFFQKLSELASNGFPLRTERRYVIAFQLCLHLESQQMTIGMHPTNETWAIQIKRFLVGYSLVIDPIHDLRWTRFSDGYHLDQNVSSRELVSKHFVFLDTVANHEKYNEKYVPEPIRRSLQQLTKSQFKASQILRKKSQSIVMDDRTMHELQELNGWSSNELRKVPLSRRPSMALVPFRIHTTMGELMDYFRDTPNTFQTMPKGGSKNDDSDDLVQDEESSSNFVDNFDAETNTLS